MDSISQIELIDNFLKGGKYFECEGFLVGYILEGTVDNCVEGINKLLQKDERVAERINNNFFSTHNGKELFHLFLPWVLLLMFHLQIEFAMRGFF